MNLKVEEILMVIVAFLIGWFLRTMTTSENNNSVKTIGDKHTNGTQPCDRGRNYNGYNYCAVDCPGAGEGGRCVCQGRIGHFQCKPNR
jgi:hypothetical protein